MVQHNAKQFMWSWAARTKEEFHKGADEDFFPHGYNIVALAALTNLEQLEYEEKVLEHIVHTMGGSFLSDESLPFLIENGTRSGCASPTIGSVSATQCA